jgi:hypothetical protein
MMSRSSIRKAFFAALAGAAFALGAGNVAADSISYSLAFQNGGISGSGPFGTVQVNLISGTTASIIFDATSPYVFVDSSAAAVNVNATSFTVTNIAFVPSSASCANSCTGSGTVDGFGAFNLTINQHGATSNPSTEISFDLTNNSGTWASAANVLLANANGSHVAAHMVNSAANTSCTGFVSDHAGAGGGSCTTQVPIPAAAWLFGSGLVGLIGIARRRITRSFSPTAA